MTTFAVRPGSSPVACILTSTDDVEVSGIHACAMAAWAGSTAPSSQRLVVARMVKGLAVWNRTDQLLVGPPMRSLAPTTYPDDAVPILFLPGPNPTSVVGNCVAEDRPRREISMNVSMPIQPS